jgi:hypothetical protein
MIKQQKRHYTEEELLMHLLGEELPDVGIGISSHLATCPLCASLFNELDEAVKTIRSWRLEELPEGSWQLLKAQFRERIRQDSCFSRNNGILDSVFDVLRSAWDYSVECPIPAICLIGLVIAFASEKAIEFFQLQHMMPSAGQVIGILRQVL